MNQLRIRGKAVAKSALRYTPAGIAVLEASFEHEGSVTEATAERTLAFEFSLGVAMGLSWERITSDYHIAKGGLLPLGLVVMAIAPYAGARLRGNGETGTRKR